MENTTEATEAKHLREMVLWACREMAAAGFDGSFEDQIGQMLRTVRDVEEDRKELARLREQLKESV